MASINLNSEIVFSSSDSMLSHQISRYIKDGKLRKIAPRIYTTNMVDSDENIVRRNVISILEWRFPGFVISHRSAKEMKTTQNGEIFITGTYNRRFDSIPGIVVNVMAGPQPDKKDLPFGRIFVSGEYRWMLENMQSARKTGESSKVLPVAEIEKRLEGVMLAGGESAMNDYRDSLRETAERLGMQAEFEKLNKLISALLSTHSSDILTTPSAKAMSAGIPYDTDRVKLFEILFQALKNRTFYVFKNLVKTEEEFRMFAFFESYFSNYIEGTEFDVNEARQIVETGMPILRRDDDSHDILGTFKIVSNRSEMSKTPSSFSEFIEILCTRHAILMQGRPYNNPGVFKDKNNRAGNTYFVDYKLVKGTLSAGFQYYSALESAFAKALFMMFMISEIHPFTDGNGRMSRVMMNAELVKTGEPRIIVPTVYREDYLLALRALSRQAKVEPFLKVMLRLHQFSVNLYGTDFSEIDNYLKLCNAYEEPTSAKLKIIDRVFSDMA